jgi:pSer/pThr/pTyr-binding forkhead associated (FHA) protein
MWILRSDAADDDLLTLRVLPGGARTVGRSVRADFVVEAAMVSRVHCRLVSDRNGQLEVEDLNSTNGTFVNGRRIDRAVLVHGDRLRIGRLELVVSLDEGREREKDTTRGGSVTEPSRRHKPTGTRDDELEADR